VFMRKEIFPSQVLEWINDNVYKLELPNKYNISAKFNVYNFFFNIGDDLKLNEFVERGDAENQQAIQQDPLQVTIQGWIILRKQGMMRINKQHHMIHCMWQFKVKSFKGEGDDMNQ